MNFVETKTKTQRWCVVGYPENMIPNWQDVVSDSLGMPGAYCIHDLSKDTKSEHRKDHVHFLVVYDNSTTQHFIFDLFQRSLALPGKIAFLLPQPCGNIRHAFDYLIHDTDGCRKQNKEIYPASSRIILNNFDIGLYEQISLEEKKVCRRALAEYIIDSNVLNFRSFWICSYNHFKDRFSYELLEETISSYSGYLKNLVQGNFAHYQYELSQLAEKNHSDLVGSVTRD